jgi:hypothetical protein
MCSSVCFLRFVDGAAGSGEQRGGEREREHDGAGGERGGDVVREQVASVVRAGSDGRLWIARCSDGARMFGTWRARRELFQHHCQLAAWPLARLIESAAWTSGDE